MPLQVTNSQFFEERGYVMLAALDAVDEAIFNKLAAKARALRSDYFAQLNEIAAQYKRREQDTREVENA
jgi:hypothetical protein